MSTNKGLDDAVYALVKSIPKGMVCTYKDIAVAVGREGASRLIGRILNRNPNPVVVPCHRVVRSDGSIGGYKYGVEAKIELLKQEGITIIKSGKRIKVGNFSKVRFRFN